MSLNDFRHRVVGLLHLRRNKVMDNNHSTKKRVKEALDLIVASGGSGILHNELAEHMGVSPNALYPAVEPLLQDGFIVIKGERNRYYLEESPINHVNILLQVLLAYVVLPFTGFPSVMQKAMFISYMLLLVFLLYENKDDVTKGLQS